MVADTTTRPPFSDPPRALPRFNAAEPTLSSPVNSTSTSMRAPCRHRRRRHTCSPQSSTPRRKRSSSAYRTSPTASSHVYKSSQGEPSVERAINSLAHTLRAAAIGSPQTVCEISRWSASTAASQEPYKQPAPAPAAAPKGEKDKPSSRDTSQRSRSTTRVPRSAKSAPSIHADWHSHSDDEHEVPPLPELPALLPRVPLPPGNVWDMYGIQAPSHGRGRRMMNGVLKRLNPKKREPPITLLLHGNAGSTLSLAAANGSTSTLNTSYAASSTRPNTPAASIATYRTTRRPCPWDGSIDGISPPQSPTAPAPVLPPVPDTDESVEGGSSFQFSWDVELELDRGDRLREPTAVPPPRRARTEASCSPSTAATFSPPTSPALSRQSSYCSSSTPPLLAKPSVPLLVSRTAPSPTSSRPPSSLLRHVRANKSIIGAPTLVSTTSERAFAAAGGAGGVGTGRRHSMSPVPPARPVTSADDDAEEDRFETILQATLDRQRRAEQDRLVAFNVRKAAERASVAVVAAASSPDGLLKPAQSQSALLRTPSLTDSATSEESEVTTTRRVPPPAPLDLAPREHTPELDSSPSSPSTPHAAAGFRPSPYITTKMARAAAVAAAGDPLKPRRLLQLLPRHHARHRASMSLSTSPASPTAMAGDLASRPASPSHSVSTAPSSLEFDDEGCCRLSLDRDLKELELEERYTRRDTRRDTIVAAPKGFALPEEVATETLRVNIIDPSTLGLGVPIPTPEVEERIIANPRGSSLLPPHLARTSKSYSSLARSASQQSLKAPGNKVWPAWPPQWGDVQRAPYGSRRPSAASQWSNASGRSGRSFEEPDRATTPHASGKRYAHSTNASIHTFGGACDNAGGYSDDDDGDDAYTYGERRGHHSRASVGSTFSFKYDPNAVDFSIPRESNGAWA